MLHDFFILVDRNGFGFFLLALAAFWATERVVVSFINRHKPVCDCDCCQELNDGDDEVVASGGEVEDHNDT